VGDLLYVFVFFLLLVCVCVVYVDVVGEERVSFFSLMDKRGKRWASWWMFRRLGWSEGRCVDVGLDLFGESPLEYGSYLSSLTHSTRRC
jgi:hypothetical protein